MPLFILPRFAAAAKIRVRCRPLLFVSSHKAKHLMDGKAELAFLIKFLRCLEEGNVDFGAPMNDLGVQPLCLLLVGEPIVVRGPVLIAHTFPCQLMEIQWENGIPAGRNTGSLSARSLHPCLEQEGGRN